MGITGICTPCYICGSVRKGNREKALLRKRLGTEEAGGQYVRNARGAVIGILFLKEREGYLSPLFRVSRFSGLPAIPASPRNSYINAFSSPASNRFIAPCRTWKTLMVPARGLFAWIEKNIL